MRSDKRTSAYAKAKTVDPFLLHSLSSPSSPLCPIPFSPLGLLKGSVVGSVAIGIPYFRKVNILNTASSPHHQLSSFSALPTALPCIHSALSSECKSHLPSIYIASSFTEHTQNHNLAPSFRPRRGVATCLTGYLLHKHLSSALP